MIARFGVLAFAFLLFVSGLSDARAAQPDLAADKPWGPWKPDQFQVYCGMAAFRKPQKSYEPDIVYNYVKASKQERAFYLDALKPGGEDPDIPDQNKQCLERDFASHDALKAELERTLHNSLVYISKMRSPLGRKFADPAHNRLGPVVRDSRHEYAVRVYADSTFKGIMQTSFVTWANDGPYSDPSVAIIRLNPAKLSSKKWTRTWAMAHELMHVVQSKQESALAWEGGHTDAKVQKTVRSPSAREWINEGTADAISRAFVHKTLGEQKPYLHAYRSGVRNYYGLRRFDRGLTWMAKGERDQHHNKLLPGYATSSFWQYIAERYYGGDYGYIIDMYRTTKNVNNPDDWLKWVDDFLSRPRGAGGIDQSLYSVFPEFMANYVMWGDKKFKERIGDKKWQQEVFWNNGLNDPDHPAGCQTIEMTGSNFKNFKLNMEPFSAQCYKLSILDLPKNYTPVVHFVVSWRAKNSEPPMLSDELHLSASRFAFHAGGSDDCYENQKAEKTPGSHLCLLPRVPGIKVKGGGTVGGVDKNGKPQVMARPDAGNIYYQTWMTQPSRANSESVFVLTYSPLTPRDKKHDVQKNSKKLEFELHVAMSKTEATTNLKEGSQKKGMVDPGGKGLNPAQLPMQGVTPRPPLPHQLPSAHEPVGSYYMTGDMCAEGICAVSLQDYAENPMHFMMPIGSDHVTLIFDEPIKFGSKGVFKTEDLAVAVRVGQGMKTEREGKGQVTIYRFDDELLHLTASGKYCLWDHVDEMTPSGHPLSGLMSHAKVHEQEKKRECSDWRSFSGELVHPFGWMFNPDTRFTAIETRGTQAYRKLYEKTGKLQQQAMSRKPKSQPDQPSQSPKPSAKGGTLPEEHDPCRLVTKKEVEAAIGAPVVKIKKMMTFCFFDAQRNGAVQIADMDNPLNENAEQTVARLKADGKDVEVVQGYGDSAYRFGGGMFGGEQLIAYKGNRQVIVTTMSAGQSPEETRRVLDALMRKALSRM